MKTRFRKLKLRSKNCYKKKNRIGIVAKVHGIIMQGILIGGIIMQRGMKDRN